MTAAIFAALLIAVDCPKAASIEGPPELATEVRSILLERGVSVQATEGCPIVEVQLFEAEGAHRIVIRDPWGRTAERSAKSPETIAAIVVSWIERELVERAPIDDRMPKPDVSPQPIPIEVKTVDKPKSVPPAFRVFAAAELGKSIMALDEWQVGFRVGACGRLGPMCWGGTFRYSKLDFQDSIDITTEIQGALAFGRWTVTPWAGLGGGWISRPIYYPSVLPGTALWTDLPTLVTETGLTVALKLLSQLHLQLGASASLVLSFRDYGWPLSLRGALGLIWGDP